MRLDARGDPPSPALPREGGGSDARLTPTAWHTIGPFFPVGFSEGLNELAAPGARGVRMCLAGRVLQEGGGPCVNAVLEIWQADAGGRFAHPRDPGWRDADPAFRGWGRAATDATGRFAFRSVVPGGYADESGARAPHVNIAIISSGIMRRLVTTVFFPGFAEANARDPVLRCVPEQLRGLLVAREEGVGEDGAVRFRIDLVLRGDEGVETPFFVD